MQPKVRWYQKASLVVKGLTWNNLFLKVNCVCVQWASEEQEIRWYQKTCHTYQASCHALNISWLNKMKHCLFVLEMFSLLDYIMLKWRKLPGLILLYHIASNCKTQPKMKPQKKWNTGRWVGVTSKVTGHISFSLGFQSLLGESFSVLCLRHFSQLAVSVSYQTLKAVFSLDRFSLVEILPPFRVW